LIGKVSDLVVGESRIVAIDESEQTQASIILVNYPITGPVICHTERLGLGAPLGANCSALTKVSYYYKSTDSDGEFKLLYEPITALPVHLANTTTSTGETVPYIDRVEAGTINRVVYRIAVPDNPLDNERDWSPDAGWNNRLLFSFSGGCSISWKKS